MDKVQLRNRTLCNLKEKIIYKEIEMEIKQIENIVEKTNAIFSTISFIIFFQPFRSYKALGLSLIIISTGLILKHFLNIFSSKKIIGNVFIIIFLIAILLLGILTLTGGLK